MPIADTDLQYLLSGGGVNADPDASLGGSISSTEVVDATLHNLFDIVLGAETSAGDTEYRCIYVKNNHGTLTLQGANIFINSQTPNADTSVEVGLGTSTINGTEQSVVDEDTAPIGVTWEAGVGAANTLVIGDLTPGQTKAVWIKRIVGVGSSAYNGDTVTIEFDGDTAA